MLDKKQPDIDFDAVKQEKHKLKTKVTLMLNRAKSDRLRRLAATQVHPFEGNSTVKGIVPNVVARYDPFSPVDKEKVVALNNWLKLQPGYPRRKPNTTLDWWYLLRTPTKWLLETHLDAGINLLRARFFNHPEWFRSERICFVDSLFGTMWRSKYDDFVKSCPNADGSGKLLPAGSLDYYTGEEPAFCRSNKTWGLEIDDIYSTLHITGDHWVAMWISIPRRHIVIWDSAVVHASAKQIATAVEPIAVMVAYMLRELADREDKYKYPSEPFTHERIPSSGVPQNIQSGDCGVYTLKYIECHALGMMFPSKLCDANIKVIREKLAAEIFDETNVRGKEDCNRSYKLLDTYE